MSSRGARRTGSRTGTAAAIISGVVASADSQTIRGSSLTSGLSRGGRLVTHSITGTIITLTRTGTIQVIMTTATVVTAALTTARATPTARRTSVRAVIRRHRTNMCRTI